MAKIVHLSSLHFPFDSRIVLRECQSLAAAGHEVVFLAPGEHDDEVHGVRVIAFPRDTNRWHRLLIGNWRLFRLAMKQQANVYHFHDPELMIIAVVMKLLGKKLVYDVHEDMPKTVWHRPAVPRLFKPAMSLFLRATEWAYQHFADLLVSATPTIAARFPQRKSVAIRNLATIDPDKIEPPATPYSARPEHIVHVSANNCPARGTLEMLEAIEIVAKTRPAKLLLAGKMQPVNYTVQPQTHPGWQHVDYRGNLDHREVNSFVQEGRVGLCVLHDSPSYREAYPVKVFEYMAAGIPVIASDFPVWRELFRDTTAIRWVDPLDTAAIAREVEWLLDHPAEAEAMGENGRQVVLNQLNWRHDAQVLLDAYENVLGVEHPAAQTVAFPAPSPLRRAG